MNTPITYYGGKQKMVKHILPLIPPHELYCEPFVGGGAVFFAKKKSKVEVINDTNHEAINFYKQVKFHYQEIEKEIKITLHSRDAHEKASIIYNRPHWFNEFQRAWAFWTLSSQSFASKLNGSWGYDRIRATTSKKIANKREGFTEQYAIRLQDTQIECTDALRIINSRDWEKAFFYIDPPYFNSDMGHYKGYTEADFSTLLELLSGIKGKFLLSSYPSKVLKDFTTTHNWSQQEVKAKVSVAKGSRKPKTEVLTANYDLSCSSLNTTLKHPLSLTT